MRDAQRILDEMLEQVDQVIAIVASTLPPLFPNSVAEPIFTGIQKLARRL